MAIDLKSGVLKLNKLLHRKSNSLAVRVMRQLQELSQNELAALSGIAQSTLSAIESDRVKLGVERVKTLAIALKCHPGVLVFPGWEVPQQRAA